ncbi:MAG: sirohydrochlorin cobaltochelatase [Coriobacteriaceae bacterium]|nr:sirohydrochlorin cobaltochelatase [Coriobacteriaceae bacterium]
MSARTMSRRSFMTKGAIASAAALAVGAGLAGCSGSGAQKVKPAILVVSFGTSFNDSRHITIGAIESAIREKFPDYDVRRAFTSQIIIDKLKERDGVVIDNVEEALDRLVADKVQEIVVQPTHLMNGYEYDDLAKALESYKDKFKKIAFGEPLLSSDDDYYKVIAALASVSERYDDGKTALVFMGHGTEAESNKVYSTLQDKLSAEGKKNYFIGTVEATPTIEDVLKGVKAAGLKKAVLRPLMVVAGDHANNDMADLEDPESWASQLSAAGIEVECVLEGLGQIVEIDELYAAHAADAIAKAQ